jgi:predicted RNA binding protein YcfA (HicA-like mRNA interferase family)
VKHVSGADFCRALERKGWRFLRVAKNAHHVYRSRNSRFIVSVPTKGHTLKTGTQRHLMRQAGLTDADL